MWEEGILAKEILDKDASAKVFWADLADFDKRCFLAIDILA